MKFRQHGIVMALVTVLYLATVLSTLITSFVEGVIPYYIIPAQFAIASVVGLIHGILGTTALSLAI